MGAAVFFTSFEFIMANKLAITALDKPAMIPLVYLVSNLNIKTMPLIMNMPASISNRDICFLLMIGSKIAVNKVMDERHTRLTATVDSLMEAKNNIQCAPTKAPLKTNFTRVARLTLKLVLLAAK